MLTIVLGIIVSVAIFFVCIQLTDSDSVGGISTVFATFILVSIIAGLFIPISGYTDWEPTKRIDLVALSDSTIGGSSGFIYVTVSSSNVYTYRYEINSEFGTDNSTEYQTSTVDGSKVVEVEDSTIISPYLQVYERKGRKSIWTFALATHEYKYVFYVPENVISKDVNLK